MIQNSHVSLFMGETGPLCLTSLLFVMKHPHPHIYHFLLQLHLLHSLRLLLLLKLLLHLLLALSALGDPDLSGMQSNGQFHSVTGRSGRML